MKKVLFIIALVLTSLTNAQEDNFILGVNAGIPLGNLEDTHSLAYGLDASYLFGVTEQVQVGVNAGYISFNGQETNGVSNENRSYLPIAASVRFNNFEDSFFVGGDIGYAIDLSSTNEESGLYFKPFLGYNISENLKLMLAYTGIKKEQPTSGYASLGVAFKL